MELEQQLEEISNKLQRSTLKNQALTERISAMTAQYEDQDAERRVDITLLGQQKERLAIELSQLREQLENVVGLSEDVQEEETDTDVTD